MGVVSWICYHINLKAEKDRQYWNKEARKILATQLIRKKLEQGVLDLYTAKLLVRIIEESE